MWDFKYIQSLLQESSWWNVSTFASKIEHQVPNPLITAMSSTTALPGTNPSGDFPSGSKQITWSSPKAITSTSLVLLTSSYISLSIMFVLPNFIGQRTTCQLASYSDEHCYCQLFSAMQFWFQTPYICHHCRVYPYMCNL